MIDDRVGRLRREYEAEGLDDALMADNPFAQFEQWFEGVSDLGLDEPNAFVLATSTAAGRPSARAVLMKEFNREGLVFYTNMTSRKSVELIENPQAAATFVWLPLHRQVRFEGVVSSVDESVADDYFSSRPRGAQIAAHASNQSTVVASRASLIERYAELDSTFTDKVPRPESWGGWRIRPDTVEFWQGRANRFHDRIRYVQTESGWQVERLAP